MTYCCWPPTLAHVGRPASTTSTTCCLGYTHSPLVRGPASLWQAESSRGKLLIYYDDDLIGTITFVQVMAARRQQHQSSGTCIGGSSSVARLGQGDADRVPGWRPMSCLPLPGRRWQLGVRSCPRYSTPRNSVAADKKQEAATRRWKRVSLWLLPLIFPLPRFNSILCSSLQTHQLKLVYARPGSVLARGLGTPAPASTHQTRKLDRMRRPSHFWLAGASIKEPVICLILSCPCYSRCGSPCSMRCGRGHLSPLSMKA